MDQQQLPSWQQLSPGEYGNLLGQVPRELRSIISTREQAFNDIASRPFNRREIEAMLKPRREVISIAESHSSEYSYEITYWKASPKGVPTTFAVYDKTYVAFGSMIEFAHAHANAALAPARNMSMQEVAARLAGKYGVEITNYGEPRVGAAIYPTYDPMEFNSRWGTAGPQRGTSFRSPKDSAVIAPHVMIDIRSLFSLFKHRFINEGVGNASEVARIQTVKFLDYVFERWMRTNWILLELYLSICVTAAEVDLEVTYKDVPKTPETEQISKRRSTGYYNAVRRNIGCWC